MPFRISQVQTKTLNDLPFKCGWFLIQFLTTLPAAQFKQFQTRYDLTLDSKHQINSYCYEQYLTSLQIKQLSNDPSILLTPLIKDISTRQIKTKTTFSNKCIIRSIPKWSPLDSSISYKPISSDVFIVNISCSKLSNDKRIKSTSNYRRRNFLNRYITGFLQSGSEKGVFENGSYVSPHPFSEIGIHGEGQIISVTDTGVDTMHNFFYDPRYQTIEVNKTYSDHRKIYAYYSVLDSSDNEEGHGTHVSGIALGEALDTESSISLYNGVAPKAKLFFFDLGDSNEEDDLSGEFDGDEIYKLMSKSGVSICSNSWGYNSSDDTQIITVEYDKHAYENPEMLFLFAAGNEGSDDQQKDAYLYYTVNAPGDSKNCLSVGSTTNTVLSTIEEERNWVIEVDGNEIIKAEPDTFGTNPWDSNIGNPKLKQSNLSIHFFNKETGSSDINSFKDTIVYLENDKENFCDNAKEVASKGATAIMHLLDYNLPECYDNSMKLFQNSEKLFTKSKHSNRRKENKLKSDDFDFDFNEFDEFIKAPVFSLFKSIDKNSKLASIIPKPTDYFKDDKMKLSFFSSLGPSSLGINKPDIVVPGEYIISAAAGSHHNKNPLPPTYDTLMMSTGTSMATPAAAGLSSLIRQYFTQGFYPSRKSNSADSQQFKGITSSFIRAVLINSAKPFDITSILPTDDPFSPTISLSGPNIRTGFGLPNISETLLINPLRVVPNAQIKSADKHVYPLNIQHKDGKELKVTMAYLDPPLSEDSATILFADLDLHIVSPSGRLYTGNGYNNNQTEMSNTIERIIIPSNEIEIGLYKIIITSTDFEDSLIEKINYSIVVNGPFDHFDFDSNPSILKISQDSSIKCEYECKNNGICDSKTGKCKCDSDHVGFDCSTNIVQIELNQHQIIMLTPNNVVYAKIPLGSYDDSKKIIITVTSNKVDQIFKMFISDSQFNSFSDPNVLSIIADGTQSVEVPLTLYGTEEELKNPVIYIAFTTKAPMNLNLDFMLSMESADQPTSEQLYTPVPTDSPDGQPENFENGSIENSSFLESIFLFLVFFSTILIIGSIVYIVFLVVFRIRVRNQPVLTS